VKRTKVVIEIARKRVLAHLKERGAKSFPMPTGIIRVLLIVLKDADGPEEAARWRARIVEGCRRPLSGGRGRQERRRQPMTFSRGGHFARSWVALF
jgi:hypothetical protein